MADKKQSDEINQVSSTKFLAMSGSDKLKFLGKVVVFIITGGFLFPTLFSD